MPRDPGKLAARRAAARVTLREVAAILGVNASTVHRWEQAATRLPAYAFDAWRSAVTQAIRAKGGAHGGRRP